MTWIRKTDKDTFDNFAKTDHKFSVYGGATTSDGVMHCKLIVEQPKVDRRFKNKKRYVPFYTMDAYVKTRGYPNAPLMTDFSQLIGVDTLK